MSIRDIEIFRAVMNAKSTAKAAVLLSISQPAVSQAIRRLEAQAGLKLFERVRSRLVPTHESEALMREVDRYFLSFEVIEHRIRSLRSFGVGRLTIATLPALGNGFLPRAIAAFNAEARGVQISLQLMSSREVYERVLAGQADLGLMADELSTAGLESSVFSSLPGVAVMNAEHPLAKKNALTASDLSTSSFISLNPEDTSRRALESHLDALGVKLRPVVETAYTHTVCELALAGVGLGVVHPLAALDYASRGLVIKRIDQEILFTDLLVFRAGPPLPEAVKNFLREMRLTLHRDKSLMDTMVGVQSRKGLR
ncbi:LysR substrate-binding domain-containing protein [Burkholderia cepacia]|uniref:LysR substrate-binding domain-containing protein n=1 Tax=Burkholderia cepacia TaxID=292 RepID=UPI00158961CC|nr:LysR substrate-binding domain-containing protein [Burkholderia cepacia]